MKVILATAAFILFGWPVGLTACPLDLPNSTVHIRGNLLEVELAFTPAARSCGLSQRKHLPEYQGMLFIYPALSRQVYWMKDTHLPLSIAFIDASGKIINIQRMKPDQVHERYHSLKPFKYALEVNQGWFEKRKITAGDFVEIRLPATLNVR